MARIHEVARFTKQPDAVARFYASVLDRTVPETDDGAFSFDVDGVNLFIHPTSDDEPQPGWPKDVDHIAFEVEDLDAECERLRSVGFEITGPTDFPWGRSAYLHDPDGRLVELHSP